MQTKLINMNKNRFEPPQSATRSVAGAPIAAGRYGPTQTNDRAA